MVNAFPNAVGAFARGVHRFPVRVYFEDTDLSGVVYHANYLRYMERARSDTLWCAGVDQRGAFERGEGVYAVADLSIRFRAPARLDDDLIVETCLLRAFGPTAKMTQRVVRPDPVGDVVLTEATVLAAWLTLDGRPQRQPRDWIDTINRLREESAQMIEAL